MASLEQWEFVAAAATEMGVGAEALRKWRERGRVPYRWRLPLLNAVKSKGKRIDETIFDNIPQVVSAAQ